MNESRLIDELNAALEDVATPLRVPPDAAQRARTRARRRRLTRALTATVPAAGLAGALLVAVGGPGQPASRPGAQPQTARTKTGAQHPAVLTLAYVTARARAARSALSNVIVKTTYDGSVGWSYPAGRIGRTKTYGPGGKLASDELEWYTGGVVKPPVATGQTRHRIYVDYTTRTWWHLRQSAGVLKDVSLPGSLPVPQDNTGGVVTILGHRIVDGKDTIEVKYAPLRGFKPTASSSWATEYIWLDASTYLPVRTTVRDGSPNDNTPYTTDFAYLPATKANLAIFKLTPPPGFKQVPPPPFRGDGQPGLGQIP